MLHLHLGFFPRLFWEVEGPLLLTLAHKVREIGLLTWLAPSVQAEILSGSGRTMPPQVPTQGSHPSFSHSLSDGGKAKQAAHGLGRTRDWVLLTCLRLGEALIPPWDRMWPFRAGRLLNSFRQMEHVSLLLASNCSPNTPLGWPLLKG